MLVAIGGLNRVGAWRDWRVMSAYRDETKRTFEAVTSGIFVVHRCGGHREQQAG